MHVTKFGNTFLQPAEDYFEFIINKFTISNTKNNRYLNHKNWFIDDYVKLRNQVMT